ncbi:hypothetical protein [Edaphobacter flagellatus]|uniref:hypothetical protein n=1 Tax=Edaphobacter flagellatus TaxID=1933044 RepID=UPI0021B158E9|nr:hypothetical protein [Edaphobacter flagellatus]
MAKPVGIKEFTPRNSRDDLIRRVEHAPMEHAEAILASYDLLQRLYDRGVIDLCNGMLSAGDEIVEKIADVASSKEAVTGLRLALIFGNLMTSIDPAKVHMALSASERDAPPSLLSILKQASSKDARRGLAASVGLLNTLGAALSSSSAKE